MRIVNTLQSDIPAEFIYISLDTVEGESVGHWIIECAVFLPHIKDLQKESKIPFKILLRESKQYKTSILSDFGFLESDIKYSRNMVSDGPSWQNQYVVPIEPGYMMYVPNFFYVFNFSTDNELFYEYINRFRKHYVESDSIKSIPVSYIARSSKENYSHNFRTFINMNEFRSLLTDKGVHTVEVDRFSSFKPQFEVVLKSKTIIVEMGSAFVINAGLIASNSHIIIINDAVDYINNYSPVYQAIKRLMNERKNTVEIFSKGVHRTPFSVDIALFKERIKLIRCMCVICKSSEFEPINSFSEFPIMAISNDSVIDDYYEFNLVACKQCNCLQVQNIVDPAILYSDIYMNSTFSSTWLHHNNSLGKFILANTTETSFLEVGANKGDMYTILSKERTIDYTVLDMYRHAELPTEIKYINGNCEMFDFSGINTIILSHVFEHLNSPNTFIKNIKAAGVSSVFISIPNFDDLLSKKSPNIINSQHTFYCGFDYIVYMFSLYNYKCENYFIYSGDFTSLMFKFVLDFTTVPLNIPSTNIQLYKDIYIDKVASIRNTVLPPNTYIIPSGIYGQFVYYFLRDKINVIGFLDNNSQRHNKKLYGTDKLVYNPRSINYSTATILVCDCPYKDEIVTGLKAICDSILFLYI